MSRLAVSALLVLGSLALAACILNPQPFPPQSTDFGGTEPDASSDAAVPPPMGSDAGADATATAPDAGGVDASVDGGTDAKLDGAQDANVDAEGDAESDATGD